MTADRRGLLVGWCRRPIGEGVILDRYRSRSRAGRRVPLRRLPLALAHIEAVRRAAL